MRLLEIQEHLAMIRGFATKEDHETAHELADCLKNEVLRAIAEGRCANPAETAKALVDGLNGIHFYEWCS